MGVCQHRGLNFARNTKHRFSPDYTHPTQYTSRTRQRILKIPRWKSITPSHTRTHTRLYIRLASNSNLFNYETLSFPAWPRRRAKTGKIPQGREFARNSSRANAGEGDSRIVLTPSLSLSLSRQFAILALSPLRNLLSLYRTTWSRLCRWHIPLPQPPRVLIFAGACCRSHYGGKGERERD